jgi:hypothetical protein
MENKEIRHANLLVLIKETPEKTMVVLAKRCGINEVYLSLLKVRERGMGNSVARRLERGMGKPVGWMDLMHSSRRQNNAPEQTSEELELIEACRACSRRAKKTIFYLSQQLRKKT